MCKLQQIDERLEREVVEGGRKRSIRELTWTVAADRAERFTKLRTDAGFAVSLGEPRQDGEEPSGRLWCRGEVRW